MVVREDGDDEDGVGKRCASKQASGTYNVKSREGGKKKRGRSAARLAFGRDDGEVADDAYAWVLFLRNGG